MVNDDKINTRGRAKKFLSEKGAKTQESSYSGFGAFCTAFPAEIIRPDAVVHLISIYLAHICQSNAFLNRFAVISRFSDKVRHARASTPRG